MKKEIVKVENISYLLDMEHLTAIVVRGEEPYAGRVVIPATVQYGGYTYCVNTIGEGAFRGCEQLEAVSMPDTIVSIETQAFAGCKQLTKIFIPRSVKSIAPGILKDCPLVENIAVASDNPYYNSRYGCNAIIETLTDTVVAGCHFTSLPEGTVRIGNYAFAGCRNISLLVFCGMSDDEVIDLVMGSGEKMVEIEEDDTPMPVGIPETVHEIGDGAFEGCKNLVYVNLPDVKSVGVGAFRGCHIAPEDLILSDGVEYKAGVE